MMNWWNPLSGLPGAAQQQGQAMGGQNHTNNAYNAQNIGGQGMAGNAIYPPPSQFEENVPDDELEFEGKLTRWNPYALLAQYSPGLNSRKNHFGIECCQRCLMI